MVVITTTTEDSGPSSLELDDVVRAVERGEKRHNTVLFGPQFKQPFLLSKVLRRML